MIDTRDDYRTLMQAVGDLVGQDFTPDDLGVVTLESDDIRLSIEGAASEPHIALHAEVRPIRLDDAGALAAALDYNLFQQSLPGSWLALDREAQCLILCCSILRATATADTVVETIIALEEAVHRLRAAQGSTLSDHATHAFDAPASDFGIIRA